MTTSPAPAAPCASCRAAQAVDLADPANTPDAIRATDMYKNFYSAQGATRDRLTARRAACWPSR